jgi:hypothetical protein
MPTDRRPLRAFPQDTKTLGKILRSLTLEVSGSELTLVDADIPATIARDAEVTAAISAAITTHLAAGDPHPGYATAAEVSAAIVTALTNITAGVYTPTLTSVANLDGTTAYECQYLRVGNTVHVSGMLSANPTAGATPTQVGISLPVASNIGAEEDCMGTAFAPAVSEGAGIRGDAANNRAEMLWTATDTTDQKRYFSFTYSVLA